jgi:hypothetical protein
MKRFISKLGVFTFLFLSLIMAMFYFLPDNPDRYLLAYDQKIDLLRISSSAPRLLFVGGSTLSFGIDSKLIGEALHIEKVINYGLHAGMGLKYILDDVYTYTRDHDIIVIVPEYQQFYGTGAYGSIPLARIVLEHPKNWELLNLPQKFSVLKNSTGVVKEKFEYTLLHLIFHRNTSEIYALSSFNEYGDVYVHWNLPDEKIDPLSFPKSDFNYKFGEYFVEEIKKFETKGKVILLPPIIIEKGFNEIEEKTEEVADFLSNNNVPFWISPQTCVVPDDYAFNGVYHMNRKGVDFYSARIIEIVKNLRN